MAPREEDQWAAKVKKYAYGINGESATKEELEEFVYTLIYMNEEDNFTDHDVWTVFRDLCEDFTVETFGKMSSRTRSKLRKHLLQRGVYVGKNDNRANLSELLAEVVQQEEQHQWTDEGIQATTKEIGPMTTMMLRDRLNKTLDGLKSPSPPTTPRATTPTAPKSPSPAITIPPILPTTPVFPTVIPQQPAPTVTQHQYHPQFAPQQSHQQHDFQQPHQQQYNLEKPGQQQSQGTLYSKEAAMVAKMYTESQKYDGISESFDFKLAIFEDICKRAGLGPDGYMIAFPTMLKGLAQDHYYNRTLSTRTYPEACTHMRNFFEGPEFYRKNLAEWNATTKHHRREYRQACVPVPSAANRQVVQTAAWNQP